MPNFLLSIVIPVLNEEKYLAKCLDSIVSQNYNGKINIIVSDNGSSDKTIKIAQKYNCFVVRGSKKGNIASARKIGCEKAKILAQKYKDLEEIIINTDADTIFSKNYFQTVSQTFKDKNITSVSGPFIINHKQIPLKKVNRTMIKFHWLAIFFQLRFPWLFKKIWNSVIMYGSNSCLRRSIYEEIEGWDDSFEKTEDIAISLKLLKKNYKIVYLDDLRVITSLRKFIGEKGNISFKKVYQYFFKEQEFKKGFKLMKKLFK